MPEPEPDSVAEIPYRRETIGRSEQGRRLRLRYLGREDAPVRILVIAGQHGDEPLAGKAVRQFSRCLRRSGTLAANLQLALLRDANPDGAKQRTRKNAKGVDLNRDHQILAAHETRALHKFVRRWRPHLIVDVHTYPARRQHLLARRLIFCHDVFLDVPNAPGLIGQTSVRIATELMEQTLGRLGATGIRCTRYTIIRKTQRVRHSTPDATDARNGLALRYGAPTLLVEGRQPPRTEGREARQRTQQAIQQALEEIIMHVSRQAEAFLSAQLAVPDRLVMRSEYLPAAKRCTMDFRDVASGEICSIELPDLYTPEVHPTDYVVRPSAYLVPSRLTSLLKVLRRHGFENQSIEVIATMQLEQYFVTHVLHTYRTKRAPLDLVVRRSKVAPALEDFVVYSTNCEAGLALGVFLEPMSKYGLLRYRGLDLRVEPETAYPILIATERCGG